ncbi:MAG: sporulation protein YhbH [Candidatus Hatepunaea meridiana]|nr:sporulation protein YhbH [Candidatus Hatepunaea meridiana]
MAYFIQPSDYSSDRSASDRARHREKIRETIKDNIADILSDEAIIGKSGDKIIKVPIRGVKEYRFVYGDNTPGAGQGDGDTQPGDVVGKGSEDGSPMGGKAGNKPGEDYYETEITLEELTDILFEDLELPHLERKKFRVIESTRLLKPKGTKKVGIRARLDKKKSAVHRIKRKLAKERFLNEEEEKDTDGRFPFHEDDLRYKRLKEDVREESNAVVVCIMDTSGSMDATKKFLARSFYFLLYQFVKIKYRNTELVFVAHHTDAKEVTEEEFFHKGESGGTLISSGYNKALEIIRSRYHPSVWNIYAFHCSDGDNWSSDNEKAVKAARELVKVCNLFGYGEIKPGRISNFESSMFKIFEPVKSDNFAMVKITRKSEIWTAFKSLISVEKSKKVSR